MPQKSLEQYWQAFAQMNCNRHGGKTAPHKAVLLLTVVEAIESGVVKKNAIPFNEVLEDAFQKVWDRYVHDNDYFVCTASTPFWHMQNEPFWKLAYAGTSRQDVIVHGTPSAAKLKSLKAYATLEGDLFSHLQNQETRDVLKALLIRMYL